MKSAKSLRRIVYCASMISLSYSLAPRDAVAASSGITTPGITYVNQGPQWTGVARNLFYTQDQGSQLIPLAWLKALVGADGQPFLREAFARYGYLPNEDPAQTDGLPVGFTIATADDAKMVGMTCSACHTRQINVSGKSYRIDGGPAIADFETFLSDLDKVTLALGDDPTKFAAFANAVLGQKSSDSSAVDVLRADFTVWSVRFHTLVSKSLPTKRHWGPARLDAVSMIFNRLTGLDLGPSPTYLIPDNIVPATAPTRYPFLWNASVQDHTQWPGFSPNGNDIAALSRNLGEVYGVFGTFHPQNTKGSLSILDRNYVVANSANFGGLESLEGLIKRIGPPPWQWPVDAVLAARGKDIYTSWKSPNTASGQTCADCHGIHVNLPFRTWQTPIVNVQTDQSEWLVLGRYALSGKLQGASIPQAVKTILSTDSTFVLLKASVAGAIFQNSTSSFAQDAGAFNASANLAAALGGLAGAPAPAAGGPQLPLSLSPAPSVVATQTAKVSFPQLDSLFKLPGQPSETLTSAEELPPVNSYESRVLEGIWAAAPYLHNGSVPTLADLLKPPGQRPKSFQLGTAYDIANVGLAKDQPGSTFTLNTTGCDDLKSGDSNCGHTFGTEFSDDDKKALLEYMKTL